MPTGNTKNSVIFTLKFVLKLMRRSLTLGIHSGFSMTTQTAWKFKTKTANHCRGKKLNPIEPHYILSENSRVRLFGSDQE